jgi:hypothetical protein
MRSNVVGSCRSERRVCQEKEKKKMKGRKKVKEEVDVFGSSP